MNAKELFKGINNKGGIEFVNKFWKEFTGHCFIPVNPTSNSHITIKFDDGGQDMEMYFIQSNTDTSTGMKAFIFSFEAKGFLSGIDPKYYAVYVKFTKEKGVDLVFEEVTRVYSQRKYKIDFYPKETDTVFRDENI